MHGVITMHLWMLLMMFAWSLVASQNVATDNSTSLLSTSYQNHAAAPKASPDHELMAMNFPNLSTVPVGCGPEVNPIYFRLCDLTLAWGIVLETVAALGILCTVTLGFVFIVLASSVLGDQRRGVLALNVMVLLGILGLFSLVFSFVVEQHTVNCSVRRFLFGVLFALCFSCLAAHAIRLNYLVWHNRGPQSCAVCLLAVGLFLVETVINMEWLLITNVRHNPLAPDPLGDPCEFAKIDFVLALVYVMFLMAGSLVSACPVLRGNYKQWKRHGVYILVTSALSVAIWVVWVVMYLYGNDKLGYHQAWDDAVLAIALVCNGWTLIAFYFIPELVEMAKPRYWYETESPNGNHWSSQYPLPFMMDNKAFSMEDENPNEQPDDRGATGNPVSLYGNFSAQVSVLPVHQSRNLMYPDAMSRFTLARVNMEECWKYPPSSP